MDAKITRLFIFAFLLTYLVEEENIVDVAIAAGNFKTLVKLIIDINVVIKSRAASTIFAPSDEAFAKIGNFERWNRKQKLSLLLRHIVEGTTILADFESGPIRTAGWEGLDLEKYDDGNDEEGVRIFYKNNIIDVVNADIMASNGVIHVIDKVILPGKFPIFNCSFLPSIVFLTLGPSKFTVV